MSIRRSYNSIGKVALVLILTEGGYSLVPININTFAIDWNFYSYAPTRESIQTAWEAWVVGKDLTFELRDRIDLANTATLKTPNWEGLKLSALESDLNPMFNRLTIAAIADNAVSTARKDITDAILTVKSEKALASAIGILNSVGYEFTDTEIGVWNTTTAALNFSSIVSL